MDQTLTRADIADAVYEQVGLSRQESADLVDSVIDEVCDALVAEEGVKISGFGSFSVRHKNERMGRNPKTGEEIPITPRKVVVFKASHILKEKMNKGNL